MIPRPRWKILLGEWRWKILIWAIRQWVNNEMDQFEKVKFRNVFGYTTFVTISYRDEYPDSFEELDAKK